MIHIKSIQKLATLYLRDSWTDFNEIFLINYLDHELLDHGPGHYSGPQRTQIPKPFLQIKSSWSG